MWTDMWYNKGMKLRMRVFAGLFLVSLAAACHAMATCRTLRPDPTALAERIARIEADDASSRRMRASVKAETQLDVVDVLVAFDLSAQRWLSDNGKGTPDEYASMKIREMNECLVRSSIGGFRFRLAGTVCFGVDASQLRDSRGYVNLEATLLSLVDESGRVVARGEWAKVTGQREELGADVVSVLVDAGRYGNVGLGYSLEDGWGWNFSQHPERIPAFGDWAYSVCSICVADEDHSMLHEIGHNMGCGHPDRSCTDPYVMELGPQLYPYSSGYYVWIGDEGYYTIMCYNFGGLRPDGSYDSNDRFTELPYFSSPLLTYRGVPLGTSNNDNRRTLLGTYAYVAQYRAAKLPVGAESGGADVSSVPTRVFPTEFRPVKAVNGVAPYIGTVFDGDNPVAIVSLKCAKVSMKGRRVGTSKVSAVVTGLDGRQKKSPAAYVVCGYDATVTLSVKDWGMLSLTLGGEGFVGTLGNRYAVRTTAVGGEWPNSRAVVDVNFGAGTGTLPAGTLVDLLPTGSNAEPVSYVNGKWKFAPAASVRYVAVKDTATNETTYELQGTSNPQKTNRSAMKLLYNVRRGTFTGTFKVYVAATSGTRPRLQKLTAKVKGIVTGSSGSGRAEIKAVGTFPLAVRLEQ